MPSRLEELSMPDPEIYVHVEIKVDGKRRVRGTCAASPESLRFPELLLFAAKEARMAAIEQLNKPEANEN